MIEMHKIPDDCLPPPAVIDQLLRGPTLDADGRIVSNGPWHGMTPAEVLKERDEYNRLCEEDRNVQLKQIKVGKWYQTAQGVGKALSVGGTHPPLVQLLIVGPIPRGKVHLSPRDVAYECEEPQQAKGQA